MNSIQKILTFIFLGGILRIMDLNIKKIESELFRLGWTKYRLAKEMGVANQQMYSVLDSDRKNGVTLRTVNNIAKALNMDPKDLLI